MPIQNLDIAKSFHRMADLLEIEGANAFRVRAYRNAARTVEGMGDEIARMVENEEDLTELPGIGKDLAEKIVEIVRTGELRQLRDLEERIPSGLNRMMTIPGLGPKRIKALYRNLGITTRAELKTAAQEHRIQQVDGFGAKTEEAILAALQDGGEDEKRILLKEAEERAAPLAAHLEAGGDIRQLTIAGSFRRRKETVGDLDILVTCTDRVAVMDRFAAYENVEKVVSKGETRATVVLKSGLQVDLRVLGHNEYGAGLHYFTGSKAHNIAVRQRGVNRDLKINEYGVFRGDRRIAGASEEEVYEAVGLSYIEPELRENQGEIEAAEKGLLPHLIQPADIQGDLHVHTTDTDGQHSLADMAEAARRMGYKYLAVTDHSQKVRMAKGLDTGRLSRQMERIDRLNASFEDFRLLKGIEVDILEDGRLDLPDDILKQLDICIGSVHYHQNLSRKRQTERILKAMENPCLNGVGHPTARLIGRRKGLDIDMKAVMTAARENGCFLELNAHPERLDLTDVNCRFAGESGVKVAVSTDAHSTGTLAHMRYGIGQARRGWLRAEDVVNTRPLEGLLQMMKRV